MSESAQIIVPPTIANGLTGAAAAVPHDGDLDLSAPAIALAGTEGLRAIAERVAAIARLAGQARVLLAGCRMGDGATSVAGALALDLSGRLGLETLLVEAGPGGAASAQGGGAALRIRSAGAVRLWTARGVAGPSNGAAAHTGLPASSQAETVELVAELQAVAARYRAAVIDLGVVRLDARMLALARPDDPVLIVARYGCTRREELTSTAAILGLAKCRIGGVIFNAYESPACERIARMLGLGDSRAADPRAGATN